jgi:hypothetical protein
MIAKEKFWDYISQEVREYLSNRYYSKTRCLLTQDEINNIVEKEHSFIFNVMEAKIIPMLNPENYNKVEMDALVGSRIGKSEYEHQVCWRLNYHIEHGLPLDIPVKGNFNHDKMADRGWLVKHGENSYTLSDMSIGILWSKFKKVGFVE